MQSTTNRANNTKAHFPKTIVQEYFLQIENLFQRTKIFFGAQILPWANTTFSQYNNHFSDTKVLQYIKEYFLLYSKVYLRYYCTRISYCRQQ